MKTGKIEANLNNLNREFNLPYIPDLIALKVTGTEKEKVHVDLEFHQQEFECLRNKLLLSFENSHLPDLVTAKDALNDFLIRIRLR